MTAAQSNDCNDAMHAFSRPVRTRGYEADPSRAIPLAQFMAYFGMLRWEVLLDPHFELTHYLRQGHFFVIREQQIELLRRVGIGVDLDVRLWWEFVGRSSVRIVQQAVRREDKAIVAQGRITCAWLGPTRRLARIPAPHKAAALAVKGGPYQLVEQLSILPGDTVVGRRNTAANAASDGSGEVSYFDPDPIRHPPGDLNLPLVGKSAPQAWAMDLRIRPSDVDVFGHVNATHYVKLLDDVRAQANLSGAYDDHVPTPTMPWATGRSTRIAIRYDREVVADTTVKVASWPVTPTKEEPLGGAKGAVAFALQLPEGGPPACVGTVVSEGGL